MDAKAFAARASRWHGPAEDEGIHTRTTFSIVRGEASALLKEAHEVLDDAGNKAVDVRMAPLACGHTVDDPKEAVALGEALYCRACVHRCPACGCQIVPGEGELVGPGTNEQGWYHQACAASPREHFELKRSLEEAFLEARNETTKQQARLTKAQVRATLATEARTLAEMEFQQRRLELEAMREEAQRDLIAAQTAGVYASMRVQDEKIQLEAQRLEFEEVQAWERVKIEKQSLELREKQLEAQVHADAERLRLEEGRLKLQAAEVAARLEREGLLDSGTARRRLP